MTGVDFFLIAIFLLFLIPKGTRPTSVVILLAYVYYFYVCLRFNDFVFFPVVATGEFIAGSVIIVLCDRINTIKVVGYIFYLAILFNFIGLVMYENHYPATTYNNLGLLIMIAQVLAMIWRLLVDAGIYELTTNYRVFRSIRNAMHKRNNKLQNQTNKKENPKCQN